VDVTVTVYAGRFPAFVIEYRPLSASVIQTVEILFTLFFFLSLLLFSG